MSKIRKKHLKDIYGKPLCGIELGINVHNISTIEFPSSEITLKELFREEQDYICKRCKSKYIKMVSIKG
jgi:hypothetical protein